MRTPRLPKPVPKRTHQRSLVPTRRPARARFRTPKRHEKGGRRPARSVLSGRRDRRGVACGLTRRTLPYVPYVLGDDLLRGVGEVEVDEVGEAGHGRRRHEQRLGRRRKGKRERRWCGLRRRDRRRGGRLYNGDDQGIGNKLASSSCP